MWPDRKEDLSPSTCQINTATTEPISTLLAVLSAFAQAPEMLYPQIVDPQNGYTIYDAFTFSFEKDELRRRIGR